MSQQMMTFVGIPAVVLMSFVVALAVEVILLTTAIRLMGRAAVRAHARQLVSAKHSVPAAVPGPR